MRFVLPFVVFLAATPAFAIEPDRFLATYCIGCHGEEKQKGDRRFDQLDRDFAKLETLESWQEILDQINLGEMPPSKSDQPGSEEIKAMVAWANGSIGCGQPS